MGVNLVQVETSSASELTSHVKSALDAAMLGQSLIAPPALEITGMSGRCYRHFINNLVRATPESRYLEIGTWAGSTLCAAISNNLVHATAIDNWSQFGGPKARFEANLARFKTPQADVRFIESDFRTVDYSGIGKFNIYFFDGPHRYQDQYDGLVVVRPALDRQFIFIVDDWNMKQVRDGTRRTMQDNGFSSLFSIEIRTSLDNSVPKPHGAMSDWHNGYFICIAEQDGVA
jgi:hypothetical protein